MSGEQLQEAPQRRHGGGRQIDTLAAAAGSPSHGGAERGGRDSKHGGASGSGAVHDNAAVVPGVTIGDAAKEAAWRGHDETPEGNGQVVVHGDLRATGGSDDQTGSKQRIQQDVEGDESVVVERLRLLKLGRMFLFVAILPAVLGIASNSLPFPDTTIHFRPDQLIFVASWMLTIFFLYGLILGVLMPFHPEHVQNVVIATPCTWVMTLIVDWTLTVGCGMVIPWLLGRFPVPMLLPVFGAGCWFATGMYLCHTFSHYLYGDDGVVTKAHMLHVKRRDGGSATSADLPSIAAATGPTAASVNALGLLSAGAPSAEAQMAVVTRLVRRARREVLFLTAGILFNYGLLYLLFCGYLVVFNIATGDNPLWQSASAVVFASLLSVNRDVLATYFLRKGTKYIDTHSQHSIVYTMLFFSELLNQLLFPSVESVWVFVVLQVIDSGTLILSALWALPSAFYRWHRLGLEDYTAYDKFIDKVLRKVGVTSIPRPRPHHEASGSHTDGPPAASDAEARSNQVSGPATARPTSNVPHDGVDNAILSELLAGHQGAGSHVPMALNTSLTASIAVSHVIATPAPKIDPATVFTARGTVGAFRERILARSRWQKGLDAAGRAASRTARVAPAELSGVVERASRLADANAGSSAKIADDFRRERIGRRVSSRLSSRNLLRPGSSFSRTESYWNEQLQGAAAKLPELYGSHEWLVERSLIFTLTYFSEVQGAVVFISQFWFMTKGPMAGQYPFSTTNADRALLYATIALGINTIVFAAAAVVIWYRFGLNVIRLAYGMIVQNSRMRWTLFVLTAGAVKAADVFLYRYANALTYFTDRGIHHF